MGDEIAEGHMLHGGGFLGGRQAGFAGGFLLALAGAHGALGVPFGALFLFDGKDQKTGV